MLQTMMLAPVQYALNQYLQLDPELPHRLMQHEGKVLLIQVDGLPAVCYLKFVGGNLELHADYPDPVDVTLVGTPLALMRLGMSQGTDALGLLKEHVVMTGDAAFAENVKQIFDQMHIDWEELLAPWIGDLMAYEVGSTGRRLSDWMHRTCQSMQQNMTEYLQEETRQLPPRLEIEDFYQQVDELMMDVDRLRARVALLELPDHD
ncbi:MAG: sterol-binding protein [Legionellales bacterium]|nr:sterol-binding protein [Legionellales bacterium]